MSLVEKLVFVVDTIYRDEASVFPEKMASRWAGYKFS